MNSIAIIAASGIGKRMQLKNGLSKQLLEIGGFPVIWHTLRAFERAASISAVYIATKQENIELLKEMAASSGFSKVKAVIEGGNERQDSVNNCIKAIEKDIRICGSSPDAILVHDGARPFIQPGEIDEISRFSLEYGACVPATKPKDTIKYIGDNPAFFGETLERSRLLQVQTPQGFRSRLLIQAHEQAQLEEWYATDDAALVERFFPEQQIKVFETGYHNIKITTPEDIPVAEAIFGQLSTPS
ncbi:MAG: 2-C-methyl-D-erythritol 4-phosphate cytidylyltransferase [Chlorobiaceae bacterium]|nr:2-C-methyl-D-erythritol 4-phosphate cytidylyltransferase [Chlorobiaceae bacterium]